MNQDGNSSASQEPVFSSADNSTPTTNLAGAITSAPGSATNAPAKRARFGFGGRRFNADASAATPAPVANPNMPDYFNAAMGDVVIANPDTAKKGKGKKIAIIAGIVLLVAGITTAVVLLLPKIGGSVATAELKNAFNRYANFIINGDEDNSSNLTEDYKKNKLYRVQKAYAVNETGDSEYFSNAAKKFNSFYELAEKVLDSSKKEIAEKYRDALTLIAARSQYGDMSDKELYEEMDNHGKTSAVQAISDIYEKYGKDGSSGEYSYEMFEYYNLRADAYSILKDNNCVVSNNSALGKAKCNAAIKASYEAKRNEADKYKISADSLLEASKIAVITEVWDMRGIVYEK